MGIDPGLNHSAFVEINHTGKMVWFRYVTDKEKASKLIPHAGIHMPFKKDKNDNDVQLFGLRRLMWWRSVYQKLFHERVRMANPLFVGIEDYALAAQGNQHSIAEAGAQGRLAAMDHCAGLRLHDPLSVKMYLAHSGAATPEEVGDAVLQRWPETEGYTALPKEAGLDLFVAYGIAQMVLTEHRLREGLIKPSSLHEQEIRVFNRVTSRYPSNLLSRGWITRT